MDATHKKLIPSETDERRTSSWPNELKTIINMLVDLAARSLEANGKNLILTEILTAEELAIRFKVPLSSIEELARRGKLPGAFRVGKHWRFDLDLLRAALPRRDDGNS